LNGVAPEILDPKPYSAELDGVKLFNLVVILALLIFQRPCYKPESVNGLLFLFVSSYGVIKEIAL
jgi:hypothetical protein